MCVFDAGVTIPEIFLVFPWCVEGGQSLQQDDAGDLGAASSERSLRTGAGNTGGATEPEIQRAIRAAGSTPLLHLHSAEG